jgi:hypothetical protein
MKPKRRPDDNIRIIKLQIALNEMLPPDRQCSDAIAAMKLKLARLQRGLTLVVINGEQQ